MFKGVEVGCCDYISEQTGKYFVLRFLTPFITILLILANFVIKLEDFIFSSFILAFLMFAMELLTFFSQSV